MEFLLDETLMALAVVANDAASAELPRKTRPVGHFGIGRHHTPEAFIAACDRFVLSNALKAPQLKPLPSR